LYDNSFSLINILSDVQFQVMNGKSHWMASL